MEDSFRIGEEEEGQGDVEGGKDIEESFFEKEDGIEVSQIP